MKRLASILSWVLLLAAGGAVIAIATGNLFFPLASVALEAKNPGRRKRNMPSLASPSTRLARSTSTSTKTRWTSSRRVSRWTRNATGCFTRWLPIPELPPTR